MTALSTRDVLATAECPGCGHSPFQHHIAGGCTVTTYGFPEDGFQPSENCRCDRGADDALLASGAVADAATLADDETLPYDPCAPRYGSCALPPGHDGPHHGYPGSVRLIFRALAAALTERGEGRG